MGGGGPLLPIDCANRIVRVFCKNGGWGPPAVYRNTRCSGSSGQRVVVFKHRTHRVRAGEGSGALAGPTLAIPNGNNSARHGRKCKLLSLLADGFIFALDSPRLFARKVANSGRRASASARAREGVADTVLRCPHESGGDDALWRGGGGRDS